ncbi:cytochrome c oxidase assembly protein [Anaplasma bovis]|uniref:cytochrome c oxidase assembly protein n=1 Tax=Anaplasma bovis TaxID=186733 RepID=UPI002FEEEBF9
MGQKQRPGGTNVLFLLCCIILSMCCITYASVPLYRIFCKATGFGGTPQKRAVVSKDRVGKRSIKVRFNATTTDIPILFYPQHPYVTATPGIQKLIFYTAKNPHKKHVVGTAVYNVSPVQAGKYFYKIACFCFTRQIFEPEKEVAMPVSFFIDPEIENDPNTKHIREITLSYIFFPSE